jgi:hypothetical protein
VEGSLLSQLFLIILVSALVCPIFFSTLDKTMLGNQLFTAIYRAGPAMSELESSDLMHVRITSPTSLVASVIATDVITILPSGSLVTVWKEDGVWLYISVKLGAKSVNGYVQKDQTTWQPIAN